MSDDSEKDKTLVKAILDARQNLTMIDKRDLWVLVQVAYVVQAISIGKAAELLGLPIALVQKAIQPYLDTAMTRDEILKWLRDAGLAGTESYCLDDEGDTKRVAGLLAARLADRFYVIDKEPG